jgi:NADH:ubiquinone oxidoreductase subunit 3 (subunit A)
LIFVIADVVGMFLYAWGAATIPVSGALAIGIFLGLIFIALAYALYFARKRELW